MRYDENISGTGVRLEFPHRVKIHTDNCLRWKFMIQSYENGIEGSRQGAKCITVPHDWLRCRWKTLLVAAADICDAP